jgi:Sodium/hydrogen exchanger family
VLIGDLAGRLRGWSSVDSRAIGFLVSSRGAVELAMAVILLQDGVFNVQLFTIVAGVGLFTTILAPIGALRAWQSTAQSKEELLERVPSLRDVGDRYWIRTPPLPWGDVRDFHSDPSPAMTGGAPTPPPTDPSRTDPPVDASAPTLSEVPSRPPLPAARRKPPAT